jgi:hypothetical protein
MLATSPRGGCIISQGGVEYIRAGHTLGINIDEAPSDTADTMILKNANTTYMSGH